ncbi:unnamed protein product [Pedinophyceae sp. YPF-701]|nr:unnamed protein product [Pedinophyceae sp. YPF-701]
MGQKPKVFHHADSEMAEVVAGMSTLQEEFKPTPWLRWTHLQTILGQARFASIPDDCYRRQLVTIKDGGTVSLDWFTGERLPKSHTSADDPPGAETFPEGTRPVVLILHGMTGDSTAGYCKWMSYSAWREGWTPVVMNFRGMGGIELTTPLSLCAAFTGDLPCVVDAIRAAHPRAPLLGVGYSLGSMVLGKALTELPVGTLDAAMLVSNPIDGFMALRNLEKPFTISYLYNRHLATKSVRIARKNRAKLWESDVVRESWHANRLEKCTTVRDFDKALVVPMHGYRSPEEYYADSSTATHLPRIRTPTLILLAKDDPFVGRIPRAECIANPWVALVVTRKGGHVAWMEGWWPFSRQAYMDRVAVDFFNNVMAARARGKLCDATGIPPAPGMGRSSSIRRLAAQGGAAVAAGSEANTMVAPSTVSTRALPSAGLYRSERESTDGSVVRRDGSSDEEGTVKHGAERPAGGKEGGVGEEREEFADCVEEVASEESGQPAGGWSTWAACRRLLRL